MNIFLKKMPMLFLFFLSFRMDLIVEQIISFGQAKRGRLGVQIQDLTQEFSDSLGYDSTEGAFVASVEPNSPASLSNIQAGDIIIEFNGQKISSFKDLKPSSAKISLTSDAIKVNKFTILSGVPLNFSLSFSS